MEEYNMTCEKCGKEFRVLVTTMNVPGGKEKEEIYCPYCRAENGYRMTSGEVRTFKIEKEKCETNYAKTMPTDELILKAIEKCLEQASDPEQKHLFHWMKVAIQYPSIEAFFTEVQAAGQGCGKVSLSALDKAIEAVYSCKEYLADTMALSEDEKQEKLHLEKIRLNVVRTQIKDTLSFLGWLE